MTKSRAITKRKATVPKTLNINTSPITMVKPKVTMPIAINNDLSNFIPQPPQSRFLYAAIKEITIVKIHSLVVAFLKNILIILEVVMKTTTNITNFVK